MRFAKQTRLCDHHTLLKRAGANQVALAGEDQRQIARLTQRVRVFFTQCPAADIDHALAERSRLAEIVLSEEHQNQVPRHAKRLRVLLAERAAIEIRNACVQRSRLNQVAFAV